MGKQYKLYGVNDDYDACARCGKTNLKRVAWLAELDADGNELAEPQPYGTTCAARLMGVPKRKSISRGRAEAMIQEQAIEQISEAMLEIFERDDMRPTRADGGGTFLPIPIWAAYKTGKIDLEEAILQREEVHPLLAYSSRRITWEEALQYC